MPLILAALSLLAAAQAGSAAPQNTPPDELPNASVVSISPRPTAGSGTVWFLRELVVRTQSGEQRTFYLTYLGKDDPEPAPGDHCDIAFRHWRGPGGTVFGGGATPAEFDAVDTLRCRPADTH